MNTAQWIFVEWKREWQPKTKADSGGEGHSVRIFKQTRMTTEHLFFLHPFSASAGRILIEMCACFFSLAFSCPQMSACCVYMFTWVSAGLYSEYACKCVRVCLLLTYVPSFVSEDYSFPFEVRQLAQRGRSERRLRAGFHTSPTAACRLGGKYACKPQRNGE